MEQPQGAKPCSLQPATCSYPEPDQSSPLLPILLFNKTNHKEYRTKQHTKMNPTLSSYSFLVQPLKTATDPLSSFPVDFLFLKWWGFPPAVFNGIKIFKSLWVICVTVCCKGKNTVPLHDSKRGERASRESLNVVKHYKIQSGQHTMYMTVARSCWKQVTCTPIKQEYKTSHRRLQAHIFFLQFWRVNIFSTKRHNKLLVKQNET